MSNALVKNIEVIFTPEIQARAEVLASPAVAGYYVDTTTNVCLVVESGGTYVRQRQIVWVVDLSLPLGGYNDIIDGYVWIPANSKRVCRDVITSVYYPPIAEVYYQPAIPYRPESTVYKLNPGWNAGAQSSRVFVNSGFASFKVPVAVGVFVGFNNVNVGYEYAEMEHSFYCSTTTGYKIYESGVEKFNGGVFNPLWDVFKIQRVFGLVTYYVNNVLIYTSSEPSSAAVLLDASMYLGGDTIDSPRIEEVFSAASAKKLKQIHGVASNYDYDSAVNALLPLWVDNNNYAGSTNQFYALRGITTDLPFALAYGSLHPITGYANSGWLAPAYSVSNGRMYSADGQADANTLNHAGANSSIRQLSGLSSDYGYNSSLNQFLRLRTYVKPIEPVMPVEAKYLPKPVLKAFGGGFATLSSASVELQAFGHDASGENAFSHVSPAATLEAFGGGSADTLTSSAQLDISGTIVNWGRAELLSPVGALDARGVVGGVGSFLATMPMPSLVGFCGGVISVTIGGAKLESTGVVGGVGRTELTMPLFELQALATAQNYGSADLISPSAQLVHGGVAWLTSPAATLSAIGSAVVAYSYEGYNVNLSHTAESPDEVTHYTNYPFTHIVRYQNSYFGASPNGLFLLEGTTDDGVAIPYSIKTCVDDFEKNEHKTVASGYLAGKLSSPCEVTLFAGETGQESHTYNTIRGPLAQNHREKFGRGVKNRYYALGFNGSGIFELDAVELEIKTMTRRI